MNDDPSAAREDSELLRDYAETGSEPAFAELVRRRIGLVYSVALRQTHGDVHRAEDATQAVFADLARKAASLAQRPVLAGWLYRSAQFAAAGLVRAEQRRLHREEAHVMENIIAAAETQPDWERVRPVLDAALNEMTEADRDAILLRFFDGRAFGEIGAQLRLSENTARMRVERALDKLHSALSRRGITSTTAALAVALGHQAGAVMPAGLVASVTGAAMAGSAVGGSGLLVAFMSMTKVQVAIATAVVTAGITGYVAQGRTNEKLRKEISALHGSRTEIAALRAENQQLAATIDEVVALRRDDADFGRLEQQVATARRENEERMLVARAREAEQRAKAEIDRMNKEGNALVEQFKALTAKSKDASLSPEERTQAEAATKQKLTEIQAKQREVQTYTVNAHATGTLTSNPSEWIRSEDAAKGAQWTPIDNYRVSLRFPQADPASILSIYQRVTGENIVPDSSILGYAGRLDLDTGPSTKEELRSRLRAGLRRMNIILEQTPDGKTVAKVGPQ